MHYSQAFLFLYWPEKFTKMKYFHLFTGKIMFGNQMQSNIVCDQTFYCLDTLVWYAWHSVQHQHVWSPNSVWLCLVAKHFPLGQDFRRTSCNRGKSKLSIWAWNSSFMTQNWLAHSARIHCHCDQTNPRFCFMIKWQTLVKMVWTQSNIKYYQTDCDGTGEFISINLSPKCWIS